MPCACCAVRFDGLIVTPDVGIGVNIFSVVQAPETTNNPARRIPRDERSKILRSNFSLFPPEISIILFGKRFLVEKKANVT